jgi:hypothetical protein
VGGSVCLFVFVCMWRWDVFSDELGGSAAQSAPSSPRSGAGSTSRELQQPFARFAYPSAGSSGSSSLQHQPHGRSHGVKRFDETRPGASVGHRGTRSAPIGAGTARHAWSPSDVRGPRYQVRTGIVSRIKMSCFSSFIENGEKSNQLNFSTFCAWGFGVP